MRQPLAEVAAACGARLVGDGKREVESVASPASATPEDLVFAEDEERLALALRGDAGAIIAGESAAGVKTEKALLIAAHPRVAFAKAAALLAPRRRFESGVHSTAVVHSSARIGRHSAIEPHAVIGEGVVIGPRTRIGACTRVRENVRIGAECDISANVTIYANTVLGDRVVVQAGSVLGSEGFGYVRDPENNCYIKFPQVGTLIIGDDVEIGANCTIDRGALDATVIERGVKLDNMVHVAHNVFIGEDVVIAAQTGISGSSRIEKDVVVAGQVGIADHVRIESGAILGAQCGVPSNKVIRGKGVVFWGTPARPIREYLEELAALARMAKQKKSKGA